MKAHAILLAVGLLLVAGCGEEPTASPDRPTTEKRDVAPPPQFDKERPDESAVVLAEFVAHDQPLYTLRNRPVFDGLVRMENGIAAVEPFLKPVHPRLRIDWTYLTENTAHIELGLLSAMDDHLDTALNKKTQGGGTPAFGEAFHKDLTDLHEITRRLHWAATARDLKTASRAFEMLQVQLGKRPPMLVASGTGYKPESRTTLETPPEPVRDTSGDELIKGKHEDYGELAEIKLRPDMRTRYAFWPAPVGKKTLYLSATPPPKKIEYTLDMTHSVDFDTPKYPQPAIVNSRNLRDENEYSRRISTTETR